jgi:ribosomal protein L21E
MLLFFPCSALAGDVVATWVHKDGSTMKLSIRDSDHIRMDIQPDSYMLLSGSKFYQIKKSEGQWTAMDMDEMSEMMKKFGKQDSGQINTFKATYKYTGRKEKIAGYKGKVYLVEINDGAGYKQKDEVVFCTHSDIKKVNKAWMIIASRMGKMMGQGMAQAIEQSTKEAEKAGYGGILRSGSELKLQSLEKKSFSPAWYELPEGVKMVNMRGLSSAPPQVKSSSTGQNSKKKGGFAGELTKDSENAFKDESKDQTVQKVREGVRSLFKKVFE